MIKKAKSTFDRIMENPERRERFDRRYREFLLSEQALALRARDEVSIHKLAKGLGQSPLKIG